jgi:hypothetical protein
MLILYLNFKLSNQKTQFVTREHEINRDVTYGYHALRHHLASLRSFDNVPPPA